MSDKKSLNFCPNCENQIQNKESKYCSHCGYEINKTKEKVSEEKNINKEDTYKNYTSNRYKKDPVVAAILTFFLVCLGQFYNGQMLKGILFVIIFIILAYITAISSFLFIIYATYDAYKNAKYITKNDENYFYNEGA